ncbi:MAG: type II toxin-antitoxin system VapC family toxin [Magnetococcales bacterium]|nr:type II toxin-antitoxin system VapC family toxin [Magnetococcales bacterium]
MRFLLDTNIAIDLLAGRIPTLPDGAYGLSIISEIELLSLQSLRAEEEQAIHELLTVLHRIQLNEPIRDQTILLRRQHGLKLPDAVIAATAMVWQATLITNDTKLRRVSNLRSIPMSATFIQ